MRRFLFFLTATLVAAIIFSVGFFSGSRLMLHKQDTVGWLFLKSDMLLTTGAHLSLAKTYNNPSATAQMIRVLLEGYQEKRKLLNSPSDKDFFFKTDEDVSAALRILPLPSPPPLNNENSARKIIRVRPEQGATANP